MTPKRARGIEITLASRRDGPWLVAIVGCLTLGLAPFDPPHLVEKLAMLASGKLTQPIDIFDLLMHGAPWLYLLFLVVRLAVRRGSRTS